MQYFIFTNGQEVGPMTKEQIGLYNVNADTQVREETSQEWKALMFYPDLMMMYGPTFRCASAKPTTVAPQPAPQPCVPVKKEDNSWIIWVVAAVVGVPILGSILYFIFVFGLSILAAMMAG